VEAARTVRDERGLWALIGPPEELALAKISDRLNTLTRHYIKRSVLPSSGQIRRSLHGPSFDADEYDRAQAERYARGEGLY
jgi:hypothetical protein